MLKQLHTILDNIFEGKYDIGTRLQTLEKNKKTHETQIQTLEKNKVTKEKKIKTLEEQLKKLHSGFSTLQGYQSTDNTITEEEVNYAVYNYISGKIKHCEIVKPCPTFTKHIPNIYGEGNLTELDGVFILTNIPSVKKRHQTCTRNNTILKNIQKKHEDLKKNLTENHIRSYETYIRSMTNTLHSKKSVHMINTIVTSGTEQQKKKLQELLNNPISIEGDSIAFVKSRGTKKQRDMLYDIIQERYKILKTILKLDKNVHTRYENSKTPRDPIHDIIIIEAKHNITHDDISKKFLQLREIKNFIQCAKMYKNGVNTRRWSKKFMDTVDANHWDEFTHVHLFIGSSHWNSSSETYCWKRFHDEQGKKLELSGLVKINGSRYSVCIGHTKCLEGVVVLS